VNGDTAVTVESHHAGMIQIADLYACILRRYAEIVEYGMTEEFSGEDRFINDCVKMLRKRLSGRATVVSWFQIAVSDTLVMRILQRLRNLNTEAKHLFFRQSTVGNSLSKGRPTNNLHDQEVNSILGIEIVDRGDAWVAQFRQRLRFFAVTWDVGDFREWIEHQSIQKCA